jgi:hypothetical protein
VDELRAALEDHDANFKLKDIPQLSDPFAVPYLAALLATGTPPSRTRAIHALALFDTAALPAGESTFHPFQSRSLRCEV